VHESVAVQRVQQHEDDDYRLPEVAIAQEIRNKSETPEASPAEVPLPADDKEDIN
jgi:hypothetical protein